MTIIEAQAEARRLGFTTLLVQFSTNSLGKVRITWRVCRGSPGPSFREWAVYMDVQPSDVEKHLPVLLGSMITGLKKWVAENVLEPEVDS